MSQPGCSGKHQLSQDRNPEYTFDGMVIEPGSDGVALSTVSLSREKGSSDIRNLDNFNGLSNSGENSPSSDSGIHSYDEHWAVLSTKSRNSDSIQSSESTRSIVISPVAKRIVPVRQLDPHFHRGVVNSLQANLVKHGTTAPAFVNKWI